MLSSQNVPSAKMAGTKCPTARTAGTERPICQNGVASMPHCQNGRRPAKMAHWFLARSKLCGTIHIARKYGRKPVICSIPPESAENTEIRPGYVKYRGYRRRSPNPPNPQVVIPQRYPPPARKRTRTKPKGVGDVYN